MWGASFDFYLMSLRASNFAKAVLSSIVAILVTPQDSRSIYGFSLKTLKDSISLIHKFRFPKTSPNLLQISLLQGAFSPNLSSMDKNVRRKIDLQSNET